MVQHWPHIGERGVHRRDQLTPYLPPATGEGVGKGSPARGGGSVSHHTCVAGRRGVGGFHLRTARGVSADLYLSDIFLSLRPVPIGKMYKGSR